MPCLISCSLHFRFECVETFDLLAIIPISSQHQLKQKSKKKGLDIVHTHTHWSKKFLFENRSVNIPALGLRLDWFEISVSRFLSDKKANGYKPDCSFILQQFQVILSNREGFLDLGDIHYS